MNGLDNQLIIGLTIVVIIQVLSQKTSRMQYLRIRCLGSRKNGDAKNFNLFGEQAIEPFGGIISRLDLKKGLSY